MFRRHRDTSTDDFEAAVPGLADVAAAQGWQPVSGAPFDGHLEDAVHDITRTLYGEPRGMGAWARKVTRIGDTTFRDVFRLSVSGRTVTVANAWTNITPELRFVKDDMKGVAVCAVELPSILPIACVQPRRFPALMAVHDSPTGNASFDQSYSVIAAPGASGQVLTPEVQQRIAARDDWIFVAERYLLGCVSKGAFRSAEEVTQRVDDVLEIVAAIPTSVMPDHVDHSQDDLIARIERLTSIEDAMTMLQQLTPDERDQLANSDTPLAELANVRTPEEAMATFKALDSQQKMQLFAMFARVKDAERGS